MTVNYYIESGSKIVLADSDYQKLVNTLDFMPQYKNLDIKQTTRPIVLSDKSNEFVFADTEEYILEQSEKEALRLSMLNLTAADVERAIYKAKGMDFDDVVALVENSHTSEIDIKALKIELKANNFYRGNPYIDLVGTLLGFSKTQLDEFFETNDYTKLLADSSALS